jgi:hypothetical protein
MDRIKEVSVNEWLLKGGSLGEAGDPVVDVVVSGSESVSVTIAAWC